jgi:predicted transcriptional regulator YdeE
MIKLFYKLLFMTKKKKIHKDGLISVLHDKWIKPEYQNGFCFMRKENGKYRYAIGYKEKYDVMENSVLKFVD